MLRLQKDEATEAYRRIPIYLVDATNGYTPETGLSSGFTIEISKNGASQGSGSGSITEIGDGNYYYTATAGELDTLGFINVSVRHASCRDFAAIAQVVAYDPYDNFTTNINDIETDTNEIQGKLPTNYIMGSSVVTDKDDEIDAIKAKTDNLPADPASETNVDANETKIDTAITNIAAVKTDTAAILIDTDTMEADLTTEIDANETKIDTVITNIAALNNLSSSDVQTVLENNDLDHLLKVAHPSGDPTQDSIMDLVMNKDGSQTYDRSSDSLEAIRDRGDAAWITGGGGSITDILQVVPSIPTNIDLANTKTVRIALYLLNSLDDLPTTTEITPGTITIDRSGDGGTSWSNVVNAAACTEQAGQIYYDEVFDSGTGYASGDMIRITFKGQKITVAANDYEITDSTYGWMFHTRIDIGGVSTHSAADVWTESGRELSTPANYKADVSNLDQAISTTESNIRGGSETLGSIKADTAAILIDTDTMEADLTTEIDANETKIDTIITNIAALNDIAAADVWAASGRELSTPNNYKADVSALATEANATTNKNSIITEVDANETKIDSIQTDVTAIKTKTDNLPSDTSTTLEEILGLQNKNAYHDTFTYSGSNMTGCRIRTYDTKANATTHGATGLQKTYTVTITWSGSNVSSYLVVIE